PTAPVASGPILFSAQTSRSSSRNAMAIAGVLIAGGAIALAIVSTRKTDTTDTAAPTATASRPETAPVPATTPAAAAGPATATVPAAAAPLELVALGHDRDGDRLTVRGVVRNPPSGRRPERLGGAGF